MATLRDDEKIELSRVDLRLLVAFSGRSLTGYRAARVAEAEAPDWPRISNGSLRPALKSLEALTLISRQGDGYRITNLGEAVLLRELRTYKNLYGLIRS